MMGWLRALFHGHKAATVRSEVYCSCGEMIWRRTKRLPVRRR